jgi:hypothetical protein
MEIGTILSISIGTGYRHDKPAVLLNCQLEDPEDIREVEYWYSAGNYSLPSVGDSVIIAEISPEYLVAIATNRDIQIVEEHGETSLFSNDGDTIKATVKCLKNGDIDLNNGDSSAVKFEALKTEFDKLKSDFNALVTKYNGHFHAVVPPIPPAVIPTTTAPTTNTGTTTTADISPAKSESIRV